MSMLNGLNDHFDIDESVEAFEPALAPLHIENQHLKINDTEIEQLKCNNLLSSFGVSRGADGNRLNLKDTQKYLLKENTLLYDRILNNIFSFSNLMYVCIVLFVSVKNELTLTRKTNQRN